MQNRSEKTGFPSTASWSNQPVVDFNEQGDEREIDLLDLVYTLFNKIHIIGIVSVACAILCFLVSFFLITPKYQSTAKMYIVSSSKDSVVDISDLNIGTTLTKDYENLLLSYPVLDEVIEEMHLEMTSAQLAKKIEISNPTDTRILNITVTDTSPGMAADIANTVTKVAIRYLPKTMSTNAPNMAQKARASKIPVSPSVPKYSILGFLIGFILSCAVLSFLYIIDDSIQDAEALEAYFGLVPLTVIPESATESTSHGKEKKWKGMKKLWKK